MASSDCTILAVAEFDALDFDAEEKKKEKKPSKAAKRANSEGKTLKILVVDDEEEVRELEKTILESGGYEVDFAVNATEAFFKIVKNEYDLIVSDINMPEIDGYQLCEFVSSRIDIKSKKTTPVILVSGRSEPEDMFKGFESGAITYLVKPFTAQSLLTAVSSALPTR